MRRVLRSVLPLLLAEQRRLAADPLVPDPRQGRADRADEVPLERRSYEGDGVEEVPAGRIAAIPLEGNVGANRKRSRLTWISGTATSPTRRS